MNTNREMTSRRQFLRIGGATLAVIPLLAVSGGAHATTNAGMRKALKYQDMPLGEKSCANCLQFVPGASPKDLGGCKILPGDTEISPQGYCSGWAKKA
jgi:hypothetical protein